ncbi:MAG: hypothetical protein JNG88_19775, partial [Phycisphaerales bacterium]|nr:hypothetical protein [Phycisphaerales bacterium]
ITLLHRESYYTRPNEAAGESGEDDNKAELIIAKQRNGPVGTIDLHFNRQWTRFDNPDVSGRFEGSYEAQASGRNVEFPG